MRKIFITGSINADLVIKTDRVPESGETVSGYGFFSSRGGKGANQAVAASRLGGEVYMCGAVGSDSFGIDALNALRADGVNTDNIKTVQNVQTGTAVIVVSGGDNRIIVDSGANACVKAEDIDKMLLSAECGDIYLTQLENPIDVVGCGMKRAKELGMYVILNPAPANTDILPYIKYCDLITPNETELLLLGGRERLLSETETVLTTLGDKGFEIATKNGIRLYPCQKIKVIDTTAAGDTLSGGLAARLSLGESVEDAALYGSRAATLACTREGAQSSIPFASEL